MTFSKDLVMATHNGEDFVFVPGTGFFCSASCAFLPGPPRSNIVCGSHKRKCRGVFRPDHLNGHWAKAPERKP